LFVVLQFFGHVFLAVNGDRSETEEFMFRKMAVLHRIIGFTFGPAVKEFVYFSFAFSLYQTLLERLFACLVLLLLLLKWDFL